MDTVLFLHGWGGDENSFAPVISMFEKQFKCVNLKFPQFQQDDPALGTKENSPDQIKPWTLEDYANFVERRLDELGIEKCHIVGHSFGARVAVLLVGRNPERFEKLVLTGAAGIRKRRSFKTILKILWFKIKKKVGKIFGRKVVSGGSEDYRKLSDVGKVTFHNVIRRDLSAEIAKIAHSTLLIFGGNDRATPVRLGKKWQKLAQVALLKIYQYSGHFCFIDEPERFIVDVFSFLGVVYK